VSAWLYGKTGAYDAIAQSAYDESVTATWPGILRDLKSLPVVYTQGNAGTLDMLNRGEIDMGPVWVDMLLLWKSDGRMNPNIRMSLPEPGMPGQPMYMVVASGSANSEASRLFCDFIADPTVQAEFVVGKYTWYPGVDPVAVFGKCTDEAKTLLFTEVTADEIAEKGLAMPIGKYREDLQRIFEEVR
jgi:spermidine/putrescine-binding protein